MPICHCREEFWRRSKSKWKGRIHELNPFPLHSQQTPVLPMNWFISVCLLHIDFCQFCPCPLLEDGQYCWINSCILNSLLIPSFTLPPQGYERSTMSLHFILFSLRNNTKPAGLYRLFHLFYHPSCPYLLLQVFLYYCLISHGRLHIFLAGRSFPPLY